MQAFAPFYLFVASCAFYYSISMELQSSPGRQMQTWEISRLYSHIARAYAAPLRAIIGKTDSEIHNVERGGRVTVIIISRKMGLLHINARINFSLWFTGEPDVNTEYGPAQPTANAECFVIFIVIIYYHYHFCQCVYRSGCLPSRPATRHLASQSIFYWNPL